MAQRSPFKPCDVRGTYPDELNERLFSALGRAVSDVWPAPGPVALGGDARLSTPGLLSALAYGLGDARHVAAVLQPFPTPGMYYVSETCGTAITLIVTASHNPARYNGLKLLIGGEAPCEGDMGRLAAATAAAMSADAGGGPALSRSDAAAWSDRYVGQLLRLAPASRPLRVVVDPGNGCLGGIAARALRLAGHEAIEIHGAIDGGFPDRGPDPTAPGALDALGAAVREHAADLGVAFDGDGDRVVFVDGHGSVVPADATAVLLGSQAVSSGDGVVILDLRTSRLLASWLRARGAHVIWSRPGHAFVRTELRQRAARFGSEVSGHYFFAELGGDDALFAVLRLLALLGDGGPLVEMVASLPRPKVMREVRLPYSGPPGPVLAAVRERCAPLSVEDFGGGFSMDLGDAWVTARSSITEPLIALRCEAESLARLRNVADCVEAGLGSFGLSMGATVAVDPVWTAG